MDNRHNRFQLTQGGNMKQVITLTLLLSFIALSSNTVFAVDLTETGDLHVRPVILCGKTADTKEILPILTDSNGKPLTT